MQILTRFFHLLLLVTTPSMLLLPPVHVQAHDSQVYYEGGYVWDRLARGDLVTFDEMIEFIEQLENGDLDHLPDEEWVKIRDLIILLARAGVLPGEEESLEKDIQELLMDFEDDSYEYDSSYDNNWEITHALLYGQHAKNIL